MAVTKNNKVKFNIGEGIDSGDFNDAQNYMRALIGDQLYAESANWGFDTSINPYTLYCTNGHSGGVTSTVLGYLTSGSAIGNLGGVVAQWKGAPSGIPDGLTPQLLFYALDRNELATNFAAGDATHDRYDLVCISLNEADGDSQTRDFQDATTHAVTSTSMNKKTRVALTLQVVQGTPAASPTIPLVPSGYAAWVLVKVPATTAANAVPALGNMWDCRMPSRRRKVNAFLMPDNGGWAATSDGGLAVSASGSKIWAVPDLVPFPGSVPAQARIVTLSYHLKSITGSWDFVTRTGGGGSGLSDTVTRTGTTFLNAVGGNNSQQFFNGGNDLGSNGFGVLPIWTNGYGEGQVDGFSDDRFLAWRLVTGASNEQIYGVQFTLAY